MEWLRKIFLAMSVVGLLASGAGLVLVVVGADELEETAKAETVPRVEARIRDLMTIEPAEGDGKLVAMRNKLAEKSREAADRMLGADFPERIRAQIEEFCVCRMTGAEQQAVMRRYDEARAGLKAKFDAALKGNLSALKMEEGMLGDLVGGYYVDTVHGLQRELRIFFGVNLVLFALVGFLSFLGGPSARVTLPAGALFATTLWAGYLFVFDQNWLAKIVFHNWAGYGYLVLVAIQFVLVLHMARSIMRARRALMPEES